MTTPNGHHQVDVFEGVELPPDAETQALLELMALADDVEAGRLTDEGHQRAREALAVLRRGVEREPSSFRQAVALAQTNLRGSLETLTRAIETANPLRVATWGHTMPQPRQWLVDESLPAGRVALLTGEGGAGKSRLALQLAAGVASGGDHREWIASPHGSMRLGNAVPPNGASVVFASWEDEPEEFYRRLHQISGQAAPWVTPERLRGLRIVNLVGEGPIWAPEPGRHISTMAAITATGERLRRLCEQEDARLLVVDPLAAAYASDENARGLVRAFVSHWDAWGQANNCTVLMLAHPPKSAGVNYAGSTDWQGSARALWTLRADYGKSLDAGPTIWKLEFVKGNYGPRPEPLQLRWDTGGVGLRWEVVGEAVRETTDDGYEVDD
jgi:RecA-family ATPase